jgi:hypothetical protein
MARGRALNAIQAFKTMRTFGLLILVLIAALIGIRFDGNVSALGWSHVANPLDRASSDLADQEEKEQG